MGCGCKERGRMIASAARHIAHGQARAVTGRLKVAGASAAQSVRLRLSAARLAAQTRPRRKGA